jgi:hypothetical protein
MTPDQREDVPLFIGGCRVVLYTKVDDRLRPRQECDRMPFGLAICQQTNRSSFYVFTCEAGWHLEYDSWHLTLEDAKRQAEFEWNGISSRWMTPG